MNPNGVCFLRVIDRNEVCRGDHEPDEGVVVEDHELAVVGAVGVLGEQRGLREHGDGGEPGGDRVDVRVEAIVEGEEAGDRGENREAFEEPDEVELHGGEDGVADARLDDVSDGNDPVGAVVEGRCSEMGGNGGEKEAGLGIQP